MTADFTKTEQEIIVLKAVWELIDEMVNYEMFEKLSQTADVHLTFRTATHQRLFNILLVDLLSQPNKRFGLSRSSTRALQSEPSVLFPLKEVCDNPMLNVSGGRVLQQPLNSFLLWLEADCRVDRVWLPSIDLKIDIELKRVRFIKICGNIAKHSFTRLSENVKDVCDLLKANGTTIDPDQAYPLLPEFYDWFHRNVFSYHSSAIAEFLNNIRWGIYRYLMPEFARSYTKDDHLAEAYRFLYPPDCRRPAIRTMYWDLMNEVRSRPYMPIFEVSSYLKMRY